MMTLIGCHSQEIQKNSLAYSLHALYSKSFEMRDLTKLNDFMTELSPQINCESFFNGVQYEMNQEYVLYNVY